MKVQTKFKIIAASIGVTLIMAVVASVFLPNALATSVAGDARQQPPCKKPSGAKKCPQVSPTPAPTPALPTRANEPEVPGPVEPPIPDFPDFPDIPDLPDIPVPGDNEGPEVPFPMSTTLPFPWDKIQGIWNAKGFGIDLYFSFKVQTARDGRQILTVQQLDASSGKLLAQGVGLSVENDKLVRAAMSGAQGGSYMLFIGSYKDTNSVTTGRRVSKPVTVLTVRSFSDIQGDEDRQFTVSKVSNLPYTKGNPLPKPVEAY